MFVRNAIAKIDAFLFVYLLCQFSYPSFFRLVDGIKYISIYGLWRRRSNFSHLLEMKAIQLTSSYVGRWIFFIVFISIDLIVNAEERLQKGEL